MIKELKINSDKANAISQLQDQWLVRHRLFQNFILFQWLQLIQFYHYLLVLKMINSKKKLTLELVPTEMSKENLSFFPLSKRLNLRLWMIQKLIWNMLQLKVMQILTKLQEVFFSDGIIKMWIAVELLHYKPWVELVP